MKKTNQEYTYFIQQENGGNIKIGFTTQEPEKRLANLQTGSAYQLRIVGLLQGNRENKLHKNFSDIKVKGEWYKNSKELVDYIKSNSLEGYDEPLVSSPKIGKQGYLKYQTVKQVWGVSPSRGSVSTVDFDWKFDKDTKDGFFNLEEEMCNLIEENNIIDKMGFRDLTWKDMCQDDEEYWQFKTEEEFYDRDIYDEPLCEFDVFRNVCYTIEAFTDHKDNFGRQRDFFKSVYINSDEWIFMVTCEPVSSKTRMGYITNLAKVAWCMDEFCAFHFFAYDDMNDRLYDLNELAMNDFFSSANHKGMTYQPIEMLDLHDFIERRSKENSKVIT